MNHHPISLTSKLAFLKQYPSLNLFMFLASLLLLGLAASSPSIPSAVARSLSQANVPSLAITDIDTDHFPDVSVYVYGENLGAPLDSLNLTLAEDERQQTLLDRELVSVSRQIIFMTSFASSSSDDPRYNQVGQAVAALNRMSLLSPDRDHVSAKVADSLGNLQALQSWSNNYAAVSEALGRYRPDEQIDKIPLFDLLNLALNSFESTDEAAASQKIIVLFSDGLEAGSALDLTDVTQQANALQIKIHTVAVSSNFSGGQNQLKRLAALTNGHFSQLTDDEEVTSLWNWLAVTREQVVLTYRSQQARPQKISVKVEGSPLQDTRDFPTLSLAPVKVQLYQVGHDPGAPITQTLVVQPQDLTAGTLKVQLALNWIDGYTRSLKEAKYILNDQEGIATLLPSDQLVIPLAGVNPGKYKLDIKVIDELNISGEPATVTLEIPTPVSSWPWLVIAGVGVVVVTGLAGGGIYWFYQLRRRTPTLEAKILTGVQLALEKGEGPSRIELYTGQNRLGRDPGKVDHLINDPSVSRLHCQINQVDRSNMFRLLNLSSKGTKVNDKPVVEKEGWLLKPGDLIEIGRVQYRYGLVLNEGGEHRQNKDLTDDLFKVAKPKKR